MTTATHLADDVSGAPQPLDRRRHSMEAATAPPVDATSRWLTFSLDGVRYAVEVARVQEILRPRPLTPLPGAQAWIAGVMNLRGAIVPVLCLHRLLGSAPAEITEDSRILVTDVTGESVGFQVDAVGGVWHAPDRLFESAPPVGDTRRTLPVGGVFQRADGVVLALDVAAVIGQCVPSPANF